MDKRSGDHSAKPAPRRALGPGGASPFVARDDELRRLIEALSFAAEGQGSTVFLTGQPGVGKSRLAREALAMAKERGFTVLEGRASPIGAGLAYAPLVNAFRPLLRSLDSTQLQALVSDLPSLGRLFEGLRLPLPILPMEGMGNPAIEKTRLFEAVLRLLERLAREKPIALFVDDLHLADPATLELLHYLALGLSDQRALLIATHNGGTLQTSRAFRELTGSLERDGLSEEIVVPRLDRDAVDKLVRGILGGDAPVDFLTFLEAHAGGTPLFIEALIRAVIDSASLIRTDYGWNFLAEKADSLPPSVRHLILRHLERLKPIDRRVLDQIAIMGDATSHAILRAASGLEEEPLLDALARLRAAGLVAEGMEGSDVTYSLTHPLVQEVAYAELPQMVRRRAHMAAIKALESSPEGRSDNLSRLARHYRGAGPEANPERALAVLLAAGERAFTLYANEEAARHYVAALAMVRGGQGSGVRSRGSDLPAPDRYSLTPDLLPWLLERLGEAWERIGNLQPAIEVWDEALVLLSEGGAWDGDSMAMCRLRGRLAIVEWERGHFEIANAHLKAGLVLLREGLTDHEPCQELVDLHYARFLILGRLGDVAGVADTTAELLFLATRLASPAAEGQANLVASFFHLWQNDVSSARERALCALGAGERAQKLEICCRAHTILAATGMVLGDHGLVRVHAEHGLAIAHRLGAPDSVAYIHEYLAFANYLSGDWDESLRCSMEAISLARRLSHPRGLAFSLGERAMILALRGELLEAEACISEAKMAFGSPTGEGPISREVFGFIDIVEATLALERGQTERALRIAKAFTSPPALSAATMAGLMMASMPIALMLLAEAQVAAGNPESAMETARKIFGLGPTDRPYLAAFAARAEGLARQAMGQREEAADCLTRAYDAFTALDMPFEAARSLLEKAATGVMHPEPLATAAMESLSVFRRLGAIRYMDRPRQLLMGFGISPPGTRRKRLIDGGLSPRELHVARLVAEGLTNPEIADRLILSRRTVGRHLENMYARLGIGSRAALARYLAESGLLPSSGENG